MVEVPAKFMKLDNSKRANIMTITNHKIIRLEQLNADLMPKLNVKIKYLQINELMGNRKYVYLLH